MKRKGRAREKPQKGNGAPCPVIGIGASAGGIEALQKFLPAVPPDSGLALVIVMHLSPDHESALTQILARSAPIPVVTVSARTPARRTTPMSSRPTPP